MNIYIVLGVVLIAAGTILMTYGSSRVAKKQATQSTAATEEQFGELSK